MVGLSKLITVALLQLYVVGASRCQIDHCYGCELVLAQSRPQNICAFPDGCNTAEGWCQVAGWVDFRAGDGSAERELTDQARRA
jgi:hypothetical protein